MNCNPNQFLSDRAIMDELSDDPFDRNEGVDPQNMNLEKVLDIAISSKNGKHYLNLLHLKK